MLKASLPSITNTDHSLVCTQPVVDSNVHSNLYSPAPAEPWSYFHWNDHMPSARSCSRSNATSPIPSLSHVTMGRPVLSDDVTVYVTGVVSAFPFSSILVTVTVLVPGTAP